ncbi:MAG TPA: hypothetical protein VKA84_05060 [Gemmatimonadaceae bacterium]|nr:hypothetical protein [Gemmatimonadaceae bacterium]
MSDENDGFEEWLMHAARDYNSPPAETPREAMWARIEAARRSETRETPATAGGPPAVPGVIEVPRWRWTRRGLAAAAVLLIGIAIGRVSNRVVGPTPTSAGSGAVSMETARAASPAVNPTTAGGPEPLPTPFAPRIVQGTGNTRPPIRRDRAGETPRLGGEAPNVGATAGAFQLATVQHLAQAEALLTAYRVDERAGRQGDAQQLAASARDLLSTTRLLADSPAADDPAVRRLLEDLELVLAQLALLSQERSAGDRQLIDHALEERAVMPRLRTAIPAGRLSAGT